MVIKLFIKETESETDVEAYCYNYGSCLIMSYVSYEFISVSIKGVNTDLLRDGLRIFERRGSWEKF